MPPDLDTLPPALTTAQAAELLALSPSALERAARRGDPPVPFYRWGRCLRWPTEPIRRLLNGDAVTAGPSPPRERAPEASPPGL